MNIFILVALHNLAYQLGNGFYDGVRLDTK